MTTRRGSGCCVEAGSALPAAEARWLTAGRLPAADNVVTIADYIGHLSGKIVLTVPEA